MLRNLLIFSLIIFNVSAKESIPMVKVKIADSLRKVLISGTDLVRRDSLTTRLLPGKKGIYFNCARASSNNHQANKKVLVASLESKTGVMSLNNNQKYNGQLEVISDLNSESCDVIQKIDIENYIASLLSKEMNKDWPLEVLKAQAVAARSYAYYRLKNSNAIKENQFYDIESSEKHQVAGSFNDITVNTKMASDQTKGYILKDGAGNVTPVFFHARCGGRTLIPEQVWQNSIAGYKSVRCGYCEGKGQKIWRNDISIQRLRDFLTWLNRNGLIRTSDELIKYASIMSSPDSSDKLVLRVYLAQNPIQIDKVQFRKYFGVDQIESNRFEVEIGKQGVHFRGNGLGHGVGMCQVGALHLSKNGLSFKEILKYYFPEHKIVKVY